jgi:hypothetical protein
MSVATQPAREALFLRKCYIGLYAVSLFMYNRLDFTKLLSVTGLVLVFRSWSTKNAVSLSKFRQVD